MSDRSIRDDRRPPARADDVARSMGWLSLDGQALFAMATIIVAVLVLWIWEDWKAALGDAGHEFEHLARTNSVAVALAARDARRFHESVDARLRAGQRPSVELLRDELRQRFPGREIADYLPADEAAPMLSTDAAPFDRARWREQLRRVDGAGRPVLGWAYQRGGTWLLPVFFQRADGAYVVASLPTDSLMREWAAPDVPGPAPLGMRGLDERILLRQPFTPQMMGADASASPSALAMRDAAARGQSYGHVLTPATETDNVHRLIAWAEVPGAGARVLVAADRDSLTRRWIRQRASSFALVLVLLASSFAVVGWSRGRLQRAARAEARARRATEQGAALVRHALDASHDTTWQLDLASGRMVFGADLAQVLGLPGEARAAMRADERRALDWLLPQLDATTRERLTAAVERMRRDGIAIEEQFCVALPGLEPRHLVLKGGVLPGAPGELAVGTLRDVTRMVASQAEAGRALQTLQRMCLLARIGPWSVDPRSGQLELGPGTREIYGLPPDAPAGHWLEFPGADTEAMAPLVAARRRVLSEGVGYDLVLPHTAADGTQRWVRSTAMAVRGAGGEIERIDGALQDVTDSVLAQRQLDASERRLRELALVVSSSSQLLLVTDANERITWCNAAFERVSGYTLDEIRGLRPGPLLQRGRTPAETRDRMRRAVDSQQPVRGARVQNFSKSGVSYWVDLEITPVRSETGELQSFVGLQTDVTKDIERERLLAQTQALYDLATRNARIGIFEHDFATERTRWSDVMFDLTGFDPAAGPPRGRVLRERLHPQDREPTRSALRGAAQDGAVGRLELDCRLERSPGDMRWLRTQCLFERDAQGRATRLVGTVRDVTAERELSIERQARAEADARSAAKTVFLSHMSHELRTPLNAVIGYAQILDRSPLTDTGEARRRVQRIEAAGWYLLTLIDDILDLARIESGHAAIENAPVALAEVVADAIDLIVAQAEARRVVVEAALEPAWVMADARRLRQVMANLLSNAVKYNVEGGRIEVRIEPAGPAVRVHVRDTGLGMTPAQQAQLFQPFNRLGRETSGVQGTGIGLTITKTLIGLMGGTLEVASQPAVGTHVVVALPSTAPAIAAAPAVVEPGAAAAVPARALDVLCVEDNEVNAMVLEESILLLQPGWKVRRASSLAAAVASVRERVPDAVFLDQNLPDGQGLAWLAQPDCDVLRARSQVVMLTADAMPELRQRALAGGVDLVMHKPFELTELRDLLARLAAGAGARAAETAAG